MRIELLTHDYDSTSTLHQFTSDTDGLSFIIDNSANGAICNEHSLFVGPFKKVNVTVVTAHGPVTEVKNVGKLRLVLKDDEGKDWSYDIPEVVYDPDSPYCLLGIPFLGKFFAKKAGDSKVYDDETWILSRSTHSHFKWDHGRHERHFEHGDSTLPELRLYEGSSFFAAFCTRMKAYVNDKVNYAFSSAFSLFI